MLRIYTLFLISVSLLFFSFCKSEKKDSTTDFSQQINKSGAELSQIYCASCHLYPEPELLDKTTWKNSVLPQMALLFGLESPAGNPYFKMKYDEIKIVGAAKVFPSKPILPDTIWKKITQFYIETAPDSLPLIAPQQLKESKNFVANPISLNFPRGALSTFLGSSPNSSDFLLADDSRELFKLNQKGKSIDFWQLDNTATWIEEEEDGAAYVLYVGNIHPNDLPHGKLIRIDKNKQKQNIITGLTRPVHFQKQDLNQDGIEDFVICNYGNHTGRLSWYQAKEDGTYEEHILLNAPGAIKTHIEDLDNNGWPDISVLMGQGNEGVFIFYNQGNGQFKQDNPLRFSPVNGSSDFQITDFNKDGFKDIIYVNGDNADYSTILKPYHGLHIFYGNKENTFAKKAFFPISGLTKVIAEDFNKDGKLDLVASAFFPNFKTNQSVLFFENTTSDFNQPEFNIQTLAASEKGRWLLLDKGDFDQDGDMDIIAGSFTFSASPAPPKLLQDWKSSGISVMMWMNE